MHLLENGVNLIYIRNLLGHSSLTTTEIYAKCNPELKRKYIEQKTPYSPPYSPYYKYGHTLVKKVTFEDNAKDILLILESIFLKNYV